MHNLQVHLQLPNVNKTCHRLGIDFAPALTGFDIRGGRSVPAIDGIVICSEFEELVRDAHAQEMEHQAKIARQKRLSEAANLWRSVLGATLTRLRVHKSYSNNTPTRVPIPDTLGPCTSNTDSKKRKKGRGTDHTQDDPTAASLDPADLDMEEI